MKKRVKHCNYVFNIFANYEILEKLTLNHNKLLKNIVYNKKIISYFLNKKIALKI